jgi:hypothetical protein
MRLVERDSEIRELVELYKNASQGRAKIAIIYGSAGSGKTSLLSNFLKTIESSKPQLITSSACRAERAIPLAVLDQLLRGANLPMEARKRAATLLDELPAATPGTTGIPANGVGFPLPSGLWLGSLLRLVQDLALRSPVVVVVDDANCADESSIFCLLYLTRRLRSFRFLVVLTGAQCTGHKGFPLASEFLTTPGSRAIRLGFLTQEGVTKVVSEELGSSAAHRLGTEFHQSSGGNPMILTAMIKDYQAGTSTVLRATIASCISRLEPFVVLTARAVAILDTYAKAPLLYQLFELSASAAADGMRELTEIGLLWEGRFRHESIRTAVLEEMTPVEREYLHYEAARLLHESGAAPASVASHLVAANKANAEWAVSVLHREANAALARGDAQQAMMYLRLAHRSCTNRHQRAAIVAELARAVWSVAPSAVIQYLPDLMSAAQDGILDRKKFIDTIIYLLWLGKAHEAHEIIVAMENSNGWEDDIGCNSPKMWLRCIYPDLILTECRKGK